MFFDVLNRQREINKVTRQIISTPSRRAEALEVLPSGQGEASSGAPLKAMGGTEVNPTPTSCTIAPKGRHPNAHPGAPVLGCSHQGSKAGGKMFRVNVPEAVGIVPTIIKQEGVQSMATPTSQVPIEGFKSFKDAPFRHGV